MQFEVGTRSRLVSHGVDGISSIDEMQPALAELAANGDPTALVVQVLSLTARGLLISANRVLSQTKSRAVSAAN